MDVDSGRPRLGLALMLAPLAGPLAMWLSIMLYGAVAMFSAHPADGIMMGFVLPGVFYVYVFMLFGAPLAYAATLLVPLPLFLLLRATERVAWWPLTLGSALAGGALLRLYVHLIEPRGHTGFFPGAGCIAGAAVGWAF